MRKFILAAAAALSLGTAGTVMAESNFLASVENPASGVLVGSPVVQDTGSNAYPEFANTFVVVRSNVVSRDVGSAGYPVFDGLAATVPAQGVIAGVRAPGGYASGGSNTRG